MAAAVGVAVGVGGSVGRSFSADVTTVVVIAACSGVTTTVAAGCRRSVKTIGKMTVWLLVTCNVTDEAMVEVMLWVTTRFRLTSKVMGRVRDSAAFPSVTLTGNCWWMVAGVVGAVY